MSDQVTPRENVVRAWHDPEVQKARSRLMDIDLSTFIEILLPHSFLSVFSLPRSLRPSSGQISWRGGRRT
jgi:hypothetical protein